MNRTKRKIGALLLVVATPGFWAMSCSGTVAREFRDSAVDGTARWVGLTAFELMDRVFPVFLAEDGG